MALAAGSACLLLGALAGPVMPVAAAADAGGSSAGTVHTISVEYTVQPGDTLSSIAARFGVSISSLQALNGLSASSILQIGQHLAVRRFAAWLYTVQPGDTVSGIALRYGLGVGQLEAANGLVGANPVIVPGQRLVVPASGAGATDGTSRTVLQSPAPAADADPPGVSQGPSGVVERLISVVKSVLGVPYVWGGMSPAGFDCSGLVQWAFAQVGVSLPRTSFAQYTVGQPVDVPQPGDLVFFQTYSPGASHVGVYVGDGQFITAIAPAVSMQMLDSSYWASRYLGARAVLP